MGLNSFFFCQGCFIRIGSGRRHFRPWVEIVTYRDIFNQQAKDNIVQLERDGALGESLLKFK